MSVYDKISPDVATDGARSAMWDFNQSKPIANSIFVVIKHRKGGGTNHVVLRRIKLSVYTRPSILLFRLMPIPSTILARTF